MTIILTTYLPCSAKYAIIAMFTTAFFNGNSMVATAMYFLGFAIIVLGGIALKKSSVFAGEVTPFLMELPAYHLPSMKGVAIHTWERVKAYIVKAGTIIFVVCVASWFLMSFSWNCRPADFDHSMLHDIGTWLAWIFAPLGFGQWQGAVATISAELAKEQAVADLAMLAGNSDVVGTAQAIKELFIGMNGEKLASLTGLSFMLMNLFDPPCIVAVVTAFNEMGGRKWGWFALGFQFFVGYGLALVVFQLGGLFFYGQAFGIWDVMALLIVIGMAWAILRKPKAFPEREE